MTTAPTQRFIISVSFDRQLREVLVQYIPPYQSDFETFSFHPKVKSEHFISFGKGTLTFTSNRPVLRRKGIKSTRRPDYTLTNGTIRYNSHKEAIIEALDLWVLRNLDV